MTSTDERAATTYPADAPMDPALDRSMSLVRANVLALGVVPVWGAVTLLPLYLAQGGEGLGAAWDAATRPAVFIPVVIASIVVHELLHGLGFLVSGVPRSRIRFGFMLRTLTPYASTPEPLAVRRYRLSAAMPGVVLGVLPLIVGLTTGAGVLTVYAFWMLCFAGGDAIILWLVRDLSPDHLVVDHPERAGCRIVGRGFRP